MLFFKFFETICLLFCLFGVNLQFMVNASSMPCEERCSGNGGVWPFGCNLNLPFVYCSAKGACQYQKNNDPNFCCLKGCGSNPTNPSPTQSTPKKICDGKCKGSYPYGCNSNLNIVYCGLNGGCRYERNNDPNWCQFK